MPPSPSTPGELPGHLIEEIIAGDCVAFVGAGFSAPVIPEWRQLLDDLAGDAEEATARDVRTLIESGTNRDLGAAAQTLRDELGDERFFAVMQERLVDPPLDDLMRHRLSLLAGIPFRAILTTNFDDVIPGETPNRDAFLEVLRPKGHRWWSGRFWDEDRPGAAVVKLHGSVSTPEEVVFTHRDYRRLYASPAYSTFLRSVMTSTTVLYLGFSFSDAYLNELRSEVLAMLDHRGGDAPVAYAIMNDPTGAEIAYSLRHEGIQVLPVDTREGADYSGFDDYLESIHERTNPRRMLSHLLADRAVAWVGQADKQALDYMSEATESAGETTLRTVTEPRAVGEFDLAIVDSGPDWEPVVEELRDRRVVTLVLGPSDSPNERARALAAGASSYAAGWGELLQELYRTLEVTTDLPRD